MAGWLGKEQVLERGTCAPPCSPQLSPAGCTADPHSFHWSRAGTTLILPKSVRDSNSMGGERGPPSFMCLLPARLLSVPCWSRGSSDVLHPSPHGLRDGLVHPTSGNPRSAYGYMENIYQREGRKMLFYDICIDKGERK